MLSVSARIGDPGLRGASPRAAAKPAALPDTRAAKFVREAFAQAGNRRWRSMGIDIEESAVARPCGRPAAGLGPAPDPQIFLGFCASGERARAGAQQPPARDRDVRRVGLWHHGDPRRRRARVDRARRGARSAAHHGRLPWPRRTGFTAPFPIGWTARRARPSRSVRRTMAAIWWRRAFLIAGLLSARQYFDGGGKEAELREKIEALWRDR